MNWRDTGHPEGGGSERYVETIATSLATAGHDVTLFCAAYRGAPAQEDRAGMRIVRRGGKITVYAHALRMLATGKLGKPDVIVDVQNGLPFWSRIVARCPVVVLVHHVHREQWPVIYGATVARFGWWLESRAAVRLYRNCRYVTVSTVTRDELASLGVGIDRIDVIHNGTAEAPPTIARRSATPRICVLGRLVPHKRVEHALFAASILRSRWPDLRVTVVGDGWWAPQLREAAQRLGIQDVVEFLGHVTEQEKHDELARSWLLAAPSLKEGWGLVVVEAGQNGVPAIGYRSAGGLAESIVDRRTGLLVDDFDGFVQAIDNLIADASRRERLGSAAAQHAKSYDWATSSRAWEVVLKDTAEPARSTAQLLP